MFWVTSAEMSSSPLRPLLMTQTMSNARRASMNVMTRTTTLIEGLRAFDIVWVINKGRNGLELISALVTQNIIGEASRIGFGSALATIMLAISSVFVAIYVRIALREEDNT